MHNKALLAMSIDDVFNLHYQVMKDYLEAKNALDLEKTKIKKKELEDIQGFIISKRIALPPGETN